MTTEPEGGERVEDVADRLDSIRERVEAAEKYGAPGRNELEKNAHVDVPYLLSLVEEVVDLAADWKRAYPPEIFPEPPERPADGAKLAWIDPETGEQLSEPFAIGRASAAMGRFMAERLFTALRDAAQEGAE